MVKIATQVGFHYQNAVVTLEPYLTWKQETKFTYTFENFFHPYTGELIAQLNRKSLPGLLDPNYHQSLTKDFFADFYQLLPSMTVATNSFPKEIDVRNGGPYANYNWELLFHIPLTIATHLSKNQRFAEAQRWFHYIFDPTCNDTSIPPPQRYWKFLRFRQETDVQQITDLLALLSKPDTECTPDELDLKASVLNGYEAIRNKPFQPHAVARTRTIAYQYSVVMKYLDNLIAWGDSLFMQDTIESINEATQRYVLAANLLGPRPERIPPRGTVQPKTFAQLKAAGLDAMGNALVELEGQFPFNMALPSTTTTDGTADQSGPLFGIGRTLYFCIPRNEKLLTYWDTVADRLFKIRHCMNIAGVVRQLALFDPPIDPGMLVKAAAAGIDIGSIVNGLNQPSSPVRSAVVLQKALELCAEVRNMGNALLAAIEKGDSEHLALMRQGNEIKLQQLVQDSLFLQWKQAEQATEALLRTRAITLERYRYYQRLLGSTPDGSVAPDTFTLDRRELTEENWDDTYAALVDEYDLPIETLSFNQLKLAGGDSPAAQSGASGSGQLFLNSNEDAELNTHLPAARDLRLAANIVNTLSGVLTFIPEFNIDLHFWGLGASSKVAGGSKMSDAAKIAAEILQTIATWEQDQAGMAARTATYERRADEWYLQNNLAARELMQLGRQIITSLVAEQVAYHNYLNVQTTISQAIEVDDFLRSKFTNEELHGWMQGEISRLYYQYYRFAFDTARKAERTVKQELMRPELDGTSYIQFNYWDGGRKGLLSGEALFLDTKRLELAYHDNNTREFELTRNISLRQLDPLALLRLKVTGKCQITIPEALYDRDCPGHYMRRIKNVSVTIPSVVGPYTSVNCTLTLLRSTVRTSPLLKDGTYAREDTEDERFADYFGSVQQIVTSGAVNDSGLFETNLRDERFLPFEGAGAVSTWSLELPSGFRPFDYLSISDVILQVRYTARQGGAALGDQATSELRDLLAVANQSGLALLYSLRHDFPTEWSSFVNGAGDLALHVRKDDFPFMMQGETLALDGLDLYAQNGTKLVSRSIAVDLDALATSLNDAPRAFDLSIPEDATVLKRDAATQAFLVVRYRLDG